jgi:hypothetical protein
MSHDHQRSRGNSGHDPGSRAGAGPATPGKTTLVQQVQCKSGVGIHEAAERGVTGSQQSLPHLDSIQRSFGSHDVGGIRAFVGGPAATASREMGAEAYATGDAVAFAGAPDLHTAAHEAAHVVQQRAGVQLLGGVGQVGDAYEQHADAVADLVVQGKSAESALDRFAPRGGGTAQATQHKAVQRAPVKTHYGDFKDEYFSEIKNDGTTVGVDMFLKFTPNTEVDATKIGMSQAVKSFVEGNAISIDATKDRQQVKSGAGKGYYIDQLSENRNPLYATGAEPAANKDKLESYATPSPAKELTQAQKDANTANKVTGTKYEGWGEHGHRNKVGADWKTKDAELHDSPTVPTKKANSGTLFETTAVAIEGTQKGTYYGSVTWGMKTDATGKLSKVDLAKGSEAVPGQNFMASAKLWNTTTARGTLVTAAADTKVLDGTLAENFKLAKDVKLELLQQAIANDVIYLFVKVDPAAASHGGETGYVKQTDAKDKGDGKANVAMPYVDVKLTTAAIKLYKAKDKKEELVDLPKDTRLRVLSTEGDVLHIEVVDGAQVTKAGWIDKGKIKDEA